MSNNGIHSLIQSRNINVCRAFLLFYLRAPLCRQDAMMANETAAISSIQARYDRRSLVIRARCSVYRADTRLLCTYTFTHVCIITRFPGLFNASLSSAGMFLEIDIIVTVKTAKSFFRYNFKAEFRHLTCETVKTEARSRNFSTPGDFLPRTRGLKFYLPDGNWTGGPCHVGDKFSLIIPNRPISIAIFMSRSETILLLQVRSYETSTQRGSDAIYTSSTTWRKRVRRIAREKIGFLPSLLRAVHHTVAFHSRRDKYGRRYKRRIMTIGLTPPFSSAGYPPRR